MGDGLLLMWKGLNVNCTDSSGYTPLHHASLNGHREVVLKLLQFEASTNVADSKGCFPLHLAAWRGDVDIVRILIHHGPSHCRVNQQLSLSLVFLGACEPALPQVDLLWLLSNRAILLQFPSDPSLTAGREQGLHTLVRVIYRVPHTHTHHRDLQQQAIGSTLPRSQRYYSPCTPLLVSEVECV
ncbi:hypothetical protein PAMP_015107 [Pampus punctatissimus]